MARKPTDKQLAFADAKLDGLSDAAARRAAGYHPMQTNINTTPLEQARQALMQASNLRKSDVLEGIVSAIQRAQMMGEPATEIRGWEAISKMLGFNAPEVRKVDITIDQGRLRQKFEQLSDEELLQIANRPVLEGSCERLDN